MYNDLIMLLKYFENMSEVSTITPFLSKKYVEFHDELVIASFPNIKHSFENVLAAHPNLIDGSLEFRDIIKYIDALESYIVILEDTLVSENFKHQRAQNFSSED